MANRQKAEKKDKVALNKDGTPRKRMGRPPKPKPPEPPKPKRGRGRPYALMPDEKTLTTLQGLGQIQSTHEEAAAVLGVTKATFEDFLSRNIKAAETFHRAKENGKSSLRRAQIKAALNGNATMMVWLGKNLLGQTDVSKHEVTGKDGEKLIPENASSREVARAVLDILREAKTGDGQQG